MNLKQSFKNFCSRVDTNAFGEFERQKILIIESDDWGAVRLPSVNVRERLLEKGINLNEEIYTIYDGLEKDSDIDDLMEVLMQYKDSNGVHPIFTMNFVVANPNFEKIKETDYQTYYRENIDFTYQSYTDSSRVLVKVKEGMKRGVFQTQFHGTEHVNVPIWLKLLQSDEECFKLAFEYKCFGLNRSAFRGKEHIQATYDSCDQDYIISSVVYGLDLFEDLFGFRSSSFIPNNYVWNPCYNGILRDNGIRGMQGMKYTLLPKCDVVKGNYQRHNSITHITV